MAVRKKQTFEQAMARLEDIVRQLEHGDASLEQSMLLFEEGTKLSAQLHQMLQNAEQTVSMLTQREDGTPVEHPFDMEGDAT